MAAKDSVYIERIALILPNRIGDAILALPVALCLQRLFAADTDKRRQLELYCSVPIRQIFAACGVLSVQALSLRSKVSSWFSPPDWVFCLVAGSHNGGFRGRWSGGFRQANKKHLRYDEHLGFLRNDPLNPELWRYLCEICRLPEYAARFFGIVSRLGYTPAQVVEAFAWYSEFLPIRRELFDFDPPINAPYLLCCPEAAYGSSRNAYRRWPFAEYVAIAEYLAASSTAQIAFIGLDPKPAIPEHERFVDLRGRLTVWQLFQLAAGANGYVGNDTGPLHIANLAGIPTVGIYTHEDYHAPLFGSRNRAVMKPATASEVLPSLNLLLAGKRTLSSGDLCP